MPVIIHNLNNAVDVKWQLSYGAELGSALASAFRREDSSAESESTLYFAALRYLIQGLRSRVFYELGSEEESGPDGFLRSLRQINPSRLSEVINVTADDEEIGNCAGSADPIALKEQLITELARFASAEFDEKWNKNKHGLARAAEEANHLMYVHGVSAVVRAQISAVLPSMSSQAVVIDKIYNSSIDAAKRSIRFVPSFSNWPQLLVKDERDPVYIHYPMSWPGWKAVSSRHVVDELTALTRLHGLEILREVAKRPMTTMGLAERLSVDAATVSRTLKSLTSVGLVTRSVKGRNRFYELDLEKLGVLGRDLYQVILR